MTVSIITVCYNEKENISFTLDSILSQNCNNYELIICDGGSTDGTYDIVLSYKKLFTEKGIHFYSQSENDGGIYNGMNLAIEVASGEYCIFMNGGDGFHSNDIIKKACRILSRNPVDVLYGDTYIFGKGQPYICHNDISALRYDECINHQSMFIRSLYFKNRKYETSYRICADTEYWCYLLKVNAIFKHWNNVVADFRLDGMSSTKPAFYSEMESIRSQYKDLKYFSKTNPIHCTNKKYVYNDPAKQHNLNFGWTRAIKHGAWSINNESAFCFYVSNITPLILLMDISGTNQYLNKLYVNGKYLCNLENRLGIHKIFIPKEYIVSGINEFCIKSNDNIYRFCDKHPDSIDVRCLNLLLKSTEIRQAPKTLDWSIICYGCFFGWSRKEKKYTWAIGQYTTFGFYLKNTCDLQIRMKIKINEGYKNKLFVNESLFCSIDNYTGNYVFDINKELLHPGINVFKIKPSEPVIPFCCKNHESEDSRELNLFIGDLKITEILGNFRKTTKIL